MVIDRRRVRVLVPLRIWLKFRLRLRKLVGDMVVVSLLLLRLGRNLETVHVWPIYKNWVENPVTRGSLSSTQRKKEKEKNPAEADVE